MARGWESKEVESQQAQAEVSMRPKKKRVLTPEQVEQTSRRQLVELDVARIERELHATPHPRRRSQLQAALDHLNRQIADIG